MGNGVSKISYNLTDIICWLLSYLISSLIQQKLMGQICVTVFVMYYFENKYIVGAQCGLSVVGSNRLFIVIV